MAELKKVELVIVVKIDVSQIQAAVEKVTAALAEFGETCTTAGEAMTKLAASGIGPEVGSCWVLRNGQEGVWRVEPHDDPDHLFGILVVGIDGQDEERMVSLAEFNRMFQDVPVLEIPAPGSVWEFADDRDPGGVWCVPHDYRGDTTMVSLHRVDGPSALNGDVSATWTGSVANHNKTFRRSNG